MSSSLSLNNFGFVSNPAGKYNLVSGVYGVIKRIQLMDGRTVLAQQDEFNRYAAFKNVLNTNSDNVSMNTFKNLSSNGYKLAKHTTLAQSTIRVFTDPPNSNTSSANIRSNDNDKITITMIAMITIMIIKTIITIINTYNTDNVNNTN